MDTTKALALGATADAIGRPVWWALTVGGAGGAAELVNTMLHLGVNKISSLGRQHVVRANG
jgi:isopentenyl diphosphate isomerase/L-lactate dehydrogenase-like FMN-dependent dehydrogenase